MFPPCKRQGQQGYKNLKQLTNAEPVCSRLLWVKLLYVPNTIQKDNAPYQAEGYSLTQNLKHLLITFQLFSRIIRMSLEQQHCWKMLSKIMLRLTIIQKQEGIWTSTKKKINIAYHKFEWTILFFLSSQSIFKRSWRPWC